MTTCKDVVPLLGASGDGELPQDDRARVQGHLALCDACRTRSAVLSAQGTALRERVVARAASADFSRLADRVMARVSREKPSSAMAGLGIRMSELWGAHRAAFAAAGSFALAACLALAVFLRPVPLDEGAVQRAQLLADAAEPQVDEVDFGSHDGAVLQLRDKTPVIWLGEDRHQ